MSSPDRYLLARFSCALAIFSALLGSTAPSPLYPVYIAEFSLSQVMVTAIFAVYALGTLGVLLLSPKLMRLIPNQRHMLIIGLTLTALGALIFASANNLGLLLVGRLLNGTGTGAITSIASAALIELAPHHKRRTAATLATLAFTGGAAGGPALTSLMLAIGFLPLIAPFVFIAMAAFCALLGMVFAAWPERRNNGKATTMSGDINDAVTPATKPSRVLFRLACLTVGIAWMSGSALMALGANLGLSVFAIVSPGVAGLIPALFQLFAGAGQAVWGRTNAIISVLFGVLGMAAAQIVLVLAAPGAYGTLLMITVPFCGFFYGAAFVGALNLVQESAEPWNRTNDILRFYTVGYLSNALPTLALGMLVDIVGLKDAFYIFSALLVLLALFAAARAYIRNRQGLGRNFANA